MGLTKGIRFMNLRIFMTERFGGYAWEEVLTTLAPADAAALRTVVASGWYEHALRARLVRAICRREPGGGAALGREMGRFEAERDLTTVHRWFIRLVKPAFALRNMNVYWRRTEDSGRWSSEVRGGEIVARLYDWSPVEPMLCATVQGYLARTLELLAGGDVFVEHPRCRAGGDDSCEFRVDHLRVEERGAGGHAALVSGDLPAIAHELANLHDLEALADAVVEVLHGRLSFSYVALWVQERWDEAPSLLRTAGRPGTGVSRSFVLQTGGHLMGRLDVEAPRSRVETELLDQMLPHVAIALRTAGVGLDSSPPAVAERAPPTIEQRAGRIAAAAQRWRLTPREREVLDLVVQGMTNKEIACQIGCQEGTVEVHVSRTLKKSGAGNRAGVAALVWGRG
jgi:DNA-binding CsgD family transcriptional regulator